MYYPDPSGPRHIRGSPYQKYLLGTPAAERVVQPYPSEPQVSPWAARIPSDEIVEIVDVVGAFQAWSSQVDPRKAILNRVLREANVPIGSIGLGGSTSLGCQEVDADLDILVYGTDHAASCIRSIEQVLLDGEAMLMSPDLASGYAQRYGKLYGLPPEYLFNVFAQDVTKIYVRGKKISFIFTYPEVEHAQIPTLLYRNITGNSVELRARVVSNVSSWLYPRKYLVQTADGQLASVWSHHWLHKAIAQPGTLVEIVADSLNLKTMVLTKLHHRILPLRG
jgi:predicted nucleotidyltransferase